MKRRKYLATAVAFFLTSTVIWWHCECVHVTASNISTVTRHNNGDMFTALGDMCMADTCVGLSSGTATTGPAGADNGRSCTCRCLDHLPAFRDDLRICVDDIHECSLAPFVSGSTSQQIPFVFLPLKGQIVHPSKEISFAGVKTPICAISGSQFLTESGWIELRTDVDNDVPFRLFRDEGRTFLQWLGDAELRAKMSGRLILIQMLCKDLDKDPSAIDSKSVFTPCVAFRVAGTPTKYISNVSEVLFSPDAHASENETTNGLTVSEYVAIGVCSILLGLIYVASVFLYLHIRRRRRKDCTNSLEKDVERRDEQNVTTGDEGIIKNNPLLSLGRHFIGPENVFNDSSSSDNEITPDLLQHQDDTRNKLTVQVTSAVVHPLNDSFCMSLNTPMELTQIQDNSSIERLPEENVSIVETLDNREDRPETVKTFVNATARRKLYFNPAYFELHLLLAPPPAAIEFLTKIREVIAIAKQKMATKRYTPSLLGIPEEECSHTPEFIYGFPVGPASSHRSSAISLKRENSRRMQSQCSGCPGCEPSDLKSLCGKLPEFPSVSLCRSCSTSTNSVRESKQQSIRKWLEDVPILKPIPNHEDLSETVKLKPVKPSIRSQFVDIEGIEKKRVSKCGKTKAPPPPPPVSNQTPKIVYHALKKSLKKTEEEIKPNLSNQYDVIRTIRTPSPKQNLPPPDMINEAIVVDQAEEEQTEENVPQMTKQMMAAVIHEFESHCGITDHDNKIESQSSNSEPVQTKGYETDSLERNNKTKNGYSTPTDYGDVGSQPSPSLSTALPMDEELTMQNEMFKLKNSTIESTINDDEEHDYELVVLKRQEKKPLLYHLPELLQRNNGYNLVSEVYVNNGYNFGSAPSTPSGSNSSTLENPKPKIRYEQPEEKPGHLTIEVEDCPNNYIKVDDSDSFEPDTLDRKPNKSKINSAEFSDYIDSLERPRQILLRTTGSFKSDSLNCNSDLSISFNSNFNRTFGSLREIYEAKTKQSLRPSLENINFMGPFHTDSLQKALSWNKYKENEDNGKLLTLEERQKKRQRTSEPVCQIPPDVIPPSPVQMPIYEHPKPPRKVQLIEEHKPPLPPKNGNGRSTSMASTTNNLSPFTSLTLNSPSTPTGVSAPGTCPSDGQNIETTSQTSNEQVLHKNTLNNQFILSADLNKHLRDRIKNENVKKTWRKLIGQSGNSNQHKEDSGYLSTDSNESNNRNRKNRMELIKGSSSGGKESETDESSGDGHSESGAESIETHSVFFGTYRKFLRVPESIDSGVGSDSLTHIEDNIVNIPKLVY